MIILSSKDFMKKYNIKYEIMNESDLQRVYNYPINPRDWKIYSDKPSVNIDNGSKGGSHWCAYYIKNKKKNILF